MSSTPISSTYPYLPPTTNVLDPHQRARLIRSTRKLGSVLGTTPYLLDCDAPATVLPLGKARNPTSKALKRQGSIFTRHSGASSVTSFDSVSSSSLHVTSPSASSISLTQSIAPGVQSTESPPTTPPGLSITRTRSPGSKPRPLYLHLKAVSVTPTDSRSASSPLPPPSRASVSCFPVSPPSPGFSSKPDIGEIRRRQMAKLTRHLGENIPPELILASSRPKPSVTSPDRIDRRRSLSVDHTIKDAPFVHLREPSLSQTKQDWVGEWNRPDIRDVQREIRHLRTR